MKYDKFFLLAKEAGIQEAELYISTSKNLSFTIFHREVIKYSDNNGYSILARGLINGKFGTASCDSWDNKKALYLVNEIKANAGVIENDDPQFIFAGSPKYKKINTFNKELENVSIDEKIQKALELEDEIRKFDKRIVEVEATEYEESESTVLLYNSRGLKLSQKSNYFYYVGAAVAKEGEQVKSGYELFFDNDFSKFDVKKLAKEVGEATVGQLGGEPCESSTYKAVLSPDVTRAFLGAYIGAADAEEVQKKSSLFIGKLHTKIASSKLTVEDRPLQRNDGEWSVVAGEIVELDFVDFLYSSRSSRELDYAFRAVMHEISEDGIKRIAWRYLVESDVRAVVECEATEAETGKEDSPCA